MLCSQCGVEHDRNQRYCKACHAAYMRAWRPKHPLTGLAYYKDKVRSQASVAKRRGQLVPEPCQECGGAAEMHHPDYTKPLVVEWLCRSCHMAHHRNETPPPLRTGKTL